MRPTRIRVFVMKKLFFFLFVAMLFVSCGESSNGSGDKIQEAVNAVSETTPAATWDGESLKSIKYVKEDNVVELCIINAHKESESERKLGIWYIANFMTGYDYFTEEDGDGEGDKDMYMEIGPMLELLAEEGVGVRFKLKFRSGGSSSVELSPKDVKKAVKMRKEDCHDD